MLGGPLDLARRIAADPSGEPLAVTLAAITYDPDFDLPARLARYGEDRGFRFGPDARFFRTVSGFSPLRDRFRLAIGTRPAADLSVEFTDASTWEECRRLLDEYEIDLMVLDGEAAPAGGRARGAPVRGRSCPA